MRTVGVGAGKPDKKNPADAKLKKELKELKAENEQLKAENEELRAQLEEASVETPAEVPVEVSEKTQKK